VEKKLAYIENSKYPLTRLEKENSRGTTIGFYNYETISTEGENSQIGSYSHSTLVIISLTISE